MVKPHEVRFEKNECWAIFCCLSSHWFQSILGGFLRISFPPDMTCYSFFSRAPWVNFIRTHNIKLSNHSNSPFGDDLSHHPQADRQSEKPQWIYKTLDGDYEWLWYIEFTYVSITLSYWIHWVGWWINYNPIELLVFLWWNHGINWCLPHFLQKQCHESISSPFDHLHGWKKHGGSHIAAAARWFFDTHRTSWITIIICLP